MFWYKTITNKKGPSLRRGVADSEVAGRCYSVLYFIALFIMLLPACKPDISNTGVATKYFDLHGYFKKQAAALAKKSEILKTVDHNGAAESKRVKINDWTKEFNSFIESDINKPTWRDSYKIQQSGHTTIYMATDTTIKTREIIINKKEDGNVQWIKIYNFTHNPLFTSKENLTYVPDSMYKIEKTQHVKLLGINRYTITGYLKQ